MVHFIYQHFNVVLDMARHSCKKRVEESVECTENSSDIDVPRWKIKFSCWAGVLRVRFYDSISLFFMPISFSSAAIPSPLNCC